MTVNKDFLEELVDALLQLPAMAGRERRDELVCSLLVDCTHWTRLDDPRLDLLQLLRKLDDLGASAPGQQHPLVALATNASSLAERASDRSRLIKLAKEAERSTLLAAQPQPADAIELEALVETEAWVDREFVRRALEVADAVARIVVVEEAGPPTAATGWLITPRHLVTNWHVLAGRTRETSNAVLTRRAAAATAVFDVRRDRGGGTTSAPLELLSASPPLDLAVLRLTEATTRRPLQLGQREAVPGTTLNIPHYGITGALRFAIGDNVVVSNGGTPSRVQYLGQAEPVASGAPICDGRWRVVGTHRAAVRVTPVVMRGCEYHIHNEGVPLAELHEHLRGLSEVAPFVSQSDGDVGT